MPHLLNVPQAIPLLVFLFTALKVIRDPTVQDFVTVFEMILIRIALLSQCLGTPIFCAITMVAVHCR